MFESLDEQIKHDLAKQSTKKERALLYVIVGVASVVLFAGLYFGVRMMNP